MKNLNRFLKAQESDYEIALQEIKNGRKESHWIWYIFPQIVGLGFSPMTEYYAICDIDEAKRYLENEVLLHHLLEISEALLTLNSNNITEIMGYPDNLKLRSSMTLFAIADPSCEVFQNVIDKYFEGKMDDDTIKILRK